MDNSKTLKEYVAFYGSYIPASETLRGDCDRCKEIPWPPHRLRLWMEARHVKPINRPYLCIDCARHFGLVW